MVLTVKLDAIKSSKFETQVGSIDFYLTDFII